MINYHTVGMVLGLAGSALAAFVAADAPYLPAEAVGAAAGLVAALAALSVGLQRIFLPDGTVYAPSKAEPPQ